jgi:hypothetical protein
MKLTKSKQFLAGAIHASGKGWLDGAVCATQDKTDPRIGFWHKLPTKEGNQWKGAGWMGTANAIPCTKLSPNWHQTAISREEYFSAYPAEPAADAGGWIEWSGGERPAGVFAEDVEVTLRDGGVITKSAGVIDWRHFDNRSDVVAYRLHKPVPAEKLSPEAVMDAKAALMGESIEDCVRKPSVEQLAADYRNAKDYAESKQQEADDAKAAADAKLALLVGAGKALGLDVSPITEKQEPELVIADWRDLQIGDEVECLSVNNYGAEYADERIGSVGHVIAAEEPGRSGRAVKVEFDNGECYWISGWRFIRRP